MSARAAPTSGTRLATRAVLVATAATIALMAFAVFEASRAQAQLPATEEQALAVERQLLCPICTNERLDVCSTAICQDMKRIIRERLAAGSSPDDIILYFETRYGPKVRARLEPEGFNLWLYGWIGASTAAIAAAGGWFLLNLRRRAQPAPSDAGSTGGRHTDTETASDDEWLDAQIADDDDRQR